jgi:AbiV family abortive infection protein
LNTAAAQSFRGVVEHSPACASSDSGHWRANGTNDCHQHARFSLPQPFGTAKAVRDPFFSKAAREAVRQSLALADAADVIQGRGQTGVAAALYVLACEEFAKGQLFSSVADGMTSLDPGMLTKTWVVDRRTPSSHDLKQFFAGAAFLTPLLRKRIAEQWDQVVTKVDWETLPEVGTDEFLAVVKKVSEEVYTRDPERDTEIEARASLIHRLESIKQRGLYVDLVDGQVWAPKSTPREDFAAVKELYQDLIANFSERTLAGIPSKPLSLAMVNQRLIVRRQKRPAYGRLRRPSQERKSPSKPVEGPSGSDP